MLALKELGDLVVKHKDTTGLNYYLTLDRLTNTKRVICMDFNWDGEEASYRGVHVEEDRNKEHTLYSRGTSSGGDYTPTSLITYGSPDKAVNRIWQYGFFAKASDDEPLIKELKKAFHENRDRVYSDVKQEYSALDRDNRRGCLLTVTTWENEEAGNYIDSHKIFRDAVKKNVLDSWVARYRETSVGHGRCSACKENKELVGFGFPFSFRSFDKIGFAPSLNPADAWKQLPICRDCAYSLKAAQSFLDENSFSFGVGSGISYYIIPDFPLARPDDQLVKMILDGKAKETLHFFSAEDYYTNIILGNENLAMTLLFLFYTRPQQTQQRIEKYVEDVSPSWIKKLYKASERVQNRPLFGEEEIKKIVSEKREGGWVFPTLDKAIWRILPDPRKLYDRKELALEFARKILRGEKLNRSLLFGMMAPEIQRRFRSEIGRKTNFYESTLNYMLNTFMFIIFLHECELLESDEMKKTDLVEKGNLYQEFFESYSKAFDTPEKQAVFLEGVLTKMLMNVQYSRMNSTPFRSKLHGLRLDAKKVKRLLGAIDAKMAEYEVGYMDLRRTLACYMVEAEENGWDISRDEIIYYFALGLNLYRRFKVK